MLELLTTSGAIIHAPSRTGAVDQAVTLLGGLIVETTLDESADTVLHIISDGMIGTILFDEDANAYELFPEGWFVAGQAVETVPHHTIVSATLPGGWSWAK